jgi:tRNA (uracil-5-)-methyltransferase
VLHDVIALLLLLQVAYSYGREEKPAWLTAALHRPGKQALPLPGILRSPQLNGYRNKAEFTIGLDGEERPTAGFLLGNYVVSV